MVAVIVALFITVLNVSDEVQLFAVASVSPLIILNIVFIYFIRKKKAWRFAVSSILGAVGVALRVIISTQPSLEIGGGLPFGVTALYIVLGSMISLKNHEAMLELRK